MLHETADIIIANTDLITRRWVDALRRTERTEIHNELLTSEIVDGMKVMLVNLASAIAVREMPDQETAPIATLPQLYKGEADASRPTPRGTAPLTTPFARAQHAASSHGLKRQSQGYELHEVMLEYIKLRQILWDTLRAQLPVNRPALLLEILQYMDRMLDELLLCTLEHFYNASVRDLEKRAIHDPLTQLYNKEYFAQRLGEELRRAVRSGDPLTVAMLDMDHLKEINDTYGHQAGDAVITAVASAIRDTCRRSDIPCRYGGDEFAIILPETNKAQARVFADRVRRALLKLSVVITSGEGVGQSERNSGTFAQSGMPFIASVPTISAGLATFPDDARNPETLLARADAALYRAKREGRDRIAF